MYVYLQYFYLFLNSYKKIAIFFPLLLFTHQAFLKLITVSNICQIYVASILPFHWPLVAHNVPFTSTSSLSKVSYIPLSISFASLSRAIRALSTIRPS